MNDTIIFNGETYQVNPYMRGECPGCKSWEAPITTHELVVHPRREEFHRGSSRHQVDRHTPYHRETWHEFFECPVSHTRFAVPYSST